MRYQGAHLLGSADSAVVGFILSLFHEKVEFGVPEELVLQFCVLVCKVGLAFLPGLGWPFLLCPQSLEESAVDLLEGVGGKEEEAILTIYSFYHSSLLGVVRSYFIVL